MKEKHSFERSCERRNFLMKTVKELSREQLVELKGRYLDDRLFEEENRGASYGELCSADKIVSDEEIFAEYEGCIFSDDDFFATAWCCA